MPKKSMIKATLTDYKSRLIRPTQIDDTQKVSFNFKCLIEKIDKFKYKNQEKVYFDKLTERLISVSRMSREEMTIHRRNDQSLRCHPINFLDPSVSEDSFGLPNEELCEDAWQFSISANEYGRVHGYFIKDIFFIVWLDPKHELYPNAQI